MDDNIKKRLKNYERLGSKTVNDDEITNAVCQYDNGDKADNEK